MRTTLFASAAALALAIATPTLAQTPNNPLPANPSDVKDGSPSAGMPSGLPPGQDPATTSRLTPSANAAPGSAPNSSSASPAMGEGAVPADQGAAAAPPNQPAQGADASTPAPAPRAHKSHRAHSASASDDTGHWAHEPGTGESGPASARASNIDAADTRSAIAPHLPQPQAGTGATPVRYLREADRALQKHRTGEAQQALEMAETRLLDRSTPATDAKQTDDRPAIQHVNMARKALAAGDIQGARQAIQQALADRGQGNDTSAAEPGSSGGMTTNASTTQTSNPAPAAPGGSGNAAAGKVIGSGTGGGPLGTPSQDSAGGAR